MEKEFADGASAAHESRASADGCKSQKRLWWRNRRRGPARSCRNASPQQNEEPQKAPRFTTLSVSRISGGSDRGHDDPSDHGHDPPSGHDAPRQLDSHVQKSHDTGRDAYDPLEDGGTSSSGERPGGGAIASHCGPHPCRHGKRDGSRRRSLVEEHPTVDRSGSPAVAEEARRIAVHAARLWVLPIVPRLKLEVQSRKSFS